MTDERTRRPIVVGVDGSALAQTALRWASAEAARRGRPLTVVATKPGHGVAVPSQNVHIRHLTVTPAPDRAVIDATDGAAMLVIGSPGAGRTARSRLDPAAAYCARHARCPVVIVPVPRRPGGVARAEAALAVTR
ncbi:MAG TPA: universal stress protein [Actinophytocola sp.]|uniref:universal stress protein n=1 Tax=Actinophytocola sp. TaxID=1872138 RepID=UPI002DBD815B|nr:universal stress protein [Actinophytocola sp.]HEU5470796.1 universal stress protein [Actinophytocola sp.]